MYDYRDLLRTPNVEEARLALLKNLIKYCIIQSRKGLEIRQYEVSVISDTQVKLMLLPLDSEERAYIILDCNVIKEAQLHEDMSTHDLDAYTFENMKPVKARYHRNDFDKRLKSEEDSPEEMLSKEELADTELNEILNYAFDSAWIATYTDIVTGHCEWIAELNMEDEEMQEVPEELK